MPRRDVDRAIARLAAGQFGLVRRDQILSAGGDDVLIRRRRQVERLAAVAPGVYLLEGWPPSWRQSLWRAVLAAADLAIVSHRSAAGLHGLATFGPGPVEVLAPHATCQRVEGALVRRTTALPDHHLTRVDGLPVTTVERTIVDLAAVVGAKRLGQILDDAVAARLTTTSGVGRCVTELAVRGRRGIAACHSVLDERGPGTVPADSELERQLHTLVASAGLPPLRRQAPHPGPSHNRGRVDGMWPEVRVIVEVDGRRWHTRIADLRRDHQRDLDAARQGYLTVRVLAEDVRDDPDGTAGALRETYVVRQASAA